MNLKKWAFTLTLLALPCLVSAELIEMDQLNKQSIDQSIARNRASHRVGPLSPKDFAGEWILTANSTGGVSGPTAIGASFTLHGQIHFDKNGNGRFNFASGSVYAGTPGQVFPINIGPGQATVQLQITDPINGIGSIVIAAPAIGYDETLSFIATRSKKDGLAIRIEGNRTSVDSTTFGVLSYTMRRQYQ
jgi:hypothetical protein